MNALRYAIYTLVIILLFSGSIIAQDLPGFRVDRHDLLDKNGEKVLLRGVNMLGLFRDWYGEVQLPEISKTGGNV